MRKGHPASMLFLAAVVLAATACAGNPLSGSRPAAAAPDWQPLRVDSPPATQLAHADRDKFLDYLDRTGRRQAAQARTADRWGTVLLWTAGAIMLTPALYGGTYTDAMLLALFPAGYARFKKREAAELERCAEFMLETHDVFARKWSGDRLPRSEDSWREYQGDQRNIIAHGPC